MLALLLGEAVARLIGERPFSVSPPEFELVPDGPLFSVRPTGIYRHAPGATEIRLRSGFSWRMTHNEEGLRITGTNQISGDHNLWLMGCSLTHGWSVHDEESYPWLVQRVLSNVSVLNGGVSGFGTIHSRLLFHELITTQGKPDVVVYAYGTFHDLRNTFARIWQKGFVPNNRLPDLMAPKATLHEDGTLDYVMREVEYWEWPMQRASALVHGLERRYNRLEAAGLNSHQVSRELIAQWAGFCLKEEIRFVVAGISSDAGPMLDWCRQLNLETVDIAVPLSGEEYTNLPHDNHPNAKAHAEYARRLIEYFKKNPNGGFAYSDAFSAQ